MKSSAAQKRRRWSGVFMDKRLMMMGNAATMAALLNRDIAGQCYAGTVWVRGRGKPDSEEGAIQFHGQLQWLHKGFGDGGGSGLVHESLRARPRR